MSAQMDSIRTRCQSLDRCRAKFAESDPIGLEHLEWRSSGLESPALKNLHHQEHRCGVHSKLYSWGVSHRVLRSDALSVSLMALHSEVAPYVHEVLLLKLVRTCLPLICHPHECLPTPVADIFPLLPTLAST